LSIASVANGPSREPRSASCRFFNGAAGSMTRPRATLLPNRFAAQPFPGLTLGTRVRGFLSGQRLPRKKRLGAAPPAPASQTPPEGCPERPLTQRPTTSPSVLCQNPTPATSQRTVPDYTWCQWQHH
jgi:hypothetical protein